MFCPNCGAKNDDESLFCAECGTPLREVKAPEEPAQPEYETPGQQPGPEAPLQNQPAQNGQAQQTQQPDGQNVYQGNPYQGQPGPEQNRQKKPAQRKPLPKLMFVVIAEAVAAVALIVGLVMVTRSRFSPETVARNYWEATMNHEWGKAYEYCSFPDSDLLSKQMYVNANAGNDEIVDYESVKVIDTVQQAQDEMQDQLDGLGSLLGDYGDYVSDAADEAQGSGDIKQYAVEYRLKGSSEKSYTYLTLTKTKEKKFLFWDDWKVTSSESWAPNVQITIPENADMTLNGVEVDSSDAAVEDGMKTITIPYLFTGEYQMSVTEEGMQDYNRMLQVESYGIDGSYITLIPSQETVDAVAAKAGDDIKLVMESALQGKDFSEIEECFTEEAVSDGYVQDDYEYLAETLAGDGDTSGVITLQLNNMNIELSSQPDSGRIGLHVTMDKKETYRRYWSDDPGESNFELSKYITYEKDGDEWKLSDLPVRAYDF